jgi:transcriptional regulator with XRE-family HTH domain
MDIGSRINLIRRRNGLRLQDVADRCGFTKSLLSKIETGAAKPPVATLMSIAKALRVPLSALLEDHSAERTIFVPAAKNLPEAMERTDKGYLFSLVAGERVDKAMQPFLFRAKRGEIKPTPLRHDGEEFVYVLEGTLKLRVGAVEYALSRGDGLYFDADEEHDVTPVTDEAVWLAVFVEPPRRVPRARAARKRPLSRTQAPRLRKQGTP